MHSVPPRRHFWFVHASHIHPALRAEWNSLSNICLLLLLFAENLAFSSSENFLQENSQVFFSPCFFGQKFEFLKEILNKSKVFFFSIFFFFHFQESKHCSPLVRC